MNFHTSRRSFLKTSTIAGAGFLCAAGSTPKAARASALEGLAFACIGVGGKGSVDSSDVRLYGNVVALCDTDRGTLEGQAKNFASTNPKLYTDYRELYDEMMDKIDAVTVSTPDHMHSIITATAIKAGKHAYTQKPLTRTIGEARYLGYLARKHGVCTQMGTQGSSSDGMRRCVSQIKAGVIGEILEVYVWTNRPVWAQGPDRDMTIEKYAAQIREEEPDEAEALIEEKKAQIKAAKERLDWDSWIGVAPKREFWPGIYHGFQWRGWWDFGSGSLGDMACHTANMPFAACDLRNPTEVVAESSGHDFNSFPAATKIWFQFPATDNRGSIQLTWLDAKVFPSAKLFEKYGIENPTFSGAMIIGSKGCAYSADDYADNYAFLAEGGEIIKEIDGVEWRKAPVDEHSGSMDPRNKLEWVTAIRENKPELCWSNFPDHAGPLTETVLLGNLAVWTASESGKRGETIKWDAKKLEVTNLAELKTPGVAELIRPEYLNGYEKVDWSFVNETL